MNKIEPEHSRQIADVLAAGRESRYSTRLKWLLASALVLVFAGAYLWLRPGPEAARQYKTAELHRGDLTVQVTATGTLQPLNQVDVGSELSGIMQSVDVDFNDRVTQGQVLARLDTDRLEAQLIEVRASLASGIARQEEARATVLETRLRFERCQKLVPRGVCTQDELDSTRASYLRAKAMESSAAAQVDVAQATVDGTETELAKATIRSPINGIVLLRQIEPGQTVAASLQAPVLFTLAEDLAHMELHVAVDEADVGKVAEGQAAVFTVDAYPERSFPARITQVRFAPQTVDGVVTYETVLSVDNADLSLRPGMTATALITVDKLNDVLLAPNAALRFTPPPAAGEAASGGFHFGPPPLKPRSPQESGTGRKVWLLRSGELAPVQVKTGATDGSFTEITGEGVNPGDTVVLDIINAQK